MFNVCSSCGLYSEDKTIEPQDDRRGIALAICYLALVCDDDLLVQRLEARPGWRRSGEAGFVREMVALNRWFRDNAQHAKPPIALLDNTALSVQECAERVAEWVRSRR